MRVNFYTGLLAIAVTYLYDETYAIRLSNQNLIEVGSESCAYFDGTQN